MTHTVDLFVYPDCQLLDASGPWQVFASANTLLGRPHYELRLTAIEPGEVRTNGGMTLVATHALETTTPGGTLLVAGGHGVHELELGARLDVWLDPRHVYIFGEDGKLVAPAAYALAA